MNLAIVNIRHSNSGSIMATMVEENADESRIRDLLHKTQPTEAESTELATLLAARPERVMLVAKLPEALPVGTRLTNITVNSLPELEDREGEVQPEALDKRRTWFRSVGLTATSETVIEEPYQLPLASLTGATRRKASAPFRG